MVASQTLFGVTIERWLLGVLIADFLMRTLCYSKRHRSAEGFSGHPNAHFLLTDGDGNITTLASTTLAGVLNNAENEAAGDQKYVDAAVKQEVSLAAGQFESRLQQSMKDAEANTKNEVERAIADAKAEVQAMTQKIEVQDARVTQSLQELRDASAQTYVQKDVYYTLYNKQFDRLVYKSDDEYLQTKAGNQYGGSNSEKFMIVDA